MYDSLIPVSLFWAAVRSQGNFRFRQACHAAFPISIPLRFMQLYTLWIDIIGARSVSEFLFSSLRTTKPVLRHNVRRPLKKLWIVTLGIWTASPIKIFIYKRPENLSDAVILLCNICFVCNIQRRAAPCNKAAKYVIHKERRFELC